MTRGAAPTRARAVLVGAALAILVTLAASPSGQAQLQAPEAYFGFRLGTDRRLASAETIEEYFTLVASASDRVELLDIGQTTEGHRTIGAIISSPENIRNLDRIRAVNQRLADPRTVAPEEAKQLAAGHKAIVAVGAGIHASEVGATQAAGELLHTLATATDPETEDILQKVVLLLIPSLNPDGHRLIVDWYNKQVGTPYEGGPMPWLYHKYAGHDINRDAFMLNLAENRNLARFFYTQWHPQVFLTMHQMGMDGPRFFVPPNEDPIDLNYDAVVWRTAALLGSAMALELQRQGRTGVVSNAMFDYFWPGYEDSAPLGHNTVSLLTEVASVRVATPVQIAPGELRGGYRGLPEYTPRINFPSPWPGGRWTLRDIVEYNLTAVRGLLHGVAAYRAHIVENFYDMGRRAVDAGSKGGPFAFLIPPEQYDPFTTARLEELLMLGGIEIHRTLEPFRADGEPHPAGTDIIFMAQPFRAYAKTLLERQRYPARRAVAGGPPERPYDVTGWTLPEQMGVDVRTIERTFEPPPMSRIASAQVSPASVWGDRRPAYYVIDARGNAGAIAVNRLAAAGLSPSWLTASRDINGFRYEPGSIVVAHSRQAEPAVARAARELGLRVDGVRGRAPAETRPIGRARVALYKPWVESIDEGWTRWLLERYEFKFATLADADVRAGDLRARYDVIILPSIARDRLVAGHAAGAVPPEYAGGLGTAGVDALRAFVDAGGTLVCLDQSGAAAIEAFRLPVRDLASEAGDGFFCPGSILRIDLDPAHPFAYGMRPQTAGFFAFSAAYSLTPGNEGSGGPDAIRTVARYGSKDLLISGWLEGEATIAGQPAILDVPIGRGRVVLLGFRVQHRAQSHATFRLLFNTILAASPSKS